MEKFKAIQEDIENVTDKKVVKQSRIAPSAIGLIALAVIGVVGALKFEDPNSSLPTLLYTISAFLFLAGIIKLFIGRNYYLFLPTKSRIREVTLYFDPKEGQILQSSLEMKRFDELKRLKKEKDSGIKLEAMVAGDRKFIAVQVSEYIPYNYEAVTPVLCYYGEEANRLAVHAGI